MSIETSFRRELRRPDLLLQSVALAEPFDRPRTLLARVDGGYEQQRLAAVTALWDEPAEDELERTGSTEQALQRLAFGRTRLPYERWPMAVPIVIRPGSSWFSWDEAEAVLGLRYGSNLYDVLQGEVLTVTSQGWTSWPDGLSARRPRATWRASLPDPDAAQEGSAAPDRSTGPDRATGQGRTEVADRLAQLEASLTSTSEQLTSPLPDECLLHYLERMLSEFGCAGHRFTERWARGRKVRGRPVLVWAKATGGCCCDCEVLMNSFRGRSSRRRGLLCPEAIAELEAEDDPVW